MPMGHANALSSTRAHLWKRDGSRGRAEAADRHHRSVLKRVLPVPIPAPLSPRAGVGALHPKTLFERGLRELSRVRALTCCCRSARVELAGRAAVGTLLRFGFLALPCCVFAGLRLVARRCLTEPTTTRNHIMRLVVHHNKIHCRLAAMGQDRQNSN